MVLASPGTKSPFKSPSVRTSDYKQLKSPPQIVHVRLASDSFSSVVSENEGEKQIKRLKRLPLFRFPSAGRPGEEVAWLQDGHQASQWLNLFYDLAVVAVLTVFSTTHELATPSSIPTFFSYFVVICWIWTAQIHYDIRYQAEDVYHRFVKGLQITLFLYIGAASGNWNLGLIQDTASMSGLSGRQTAAYDAAAESFFTIVMAFIASRILLIGQYFVAAVLGHKAGRSKHAQVWSTIALLLSTVFSIVAATLPRLTSSQCIWKISFFYLAIAVEVLAVWFQLQRHQLSKLKTELIGERYGAFTLIILGEGFISMTRAFNRAISGLSESNTATYGQVFLAITIMYFLYLFLFGRYNKNEAIEQRRAVLWQAIHFPLHFGLLLFLAAIVNTIIVISFAHGINTVTTQFSVSIDFMRNGTSIPLGEKQGIEQYLDKLTLEPSYDVEFDYLDSLSTMAEPDADATIIGYQYFGQIILQTTLSYGLEISNPVMTLFENLYSVNTTWTTDLSLRNQRRQLASSYLLQVIQDSVDEALSGVLWLFPCAGAVMVLCAARSIIWYPYSTPAHCIIHLSMIVFGVGLAMLGLLDVGSREIDIMRKDELNKTNMMFRLLSSKLPLGIVVMVYGGVYCGTLAVLALLDRIKGGVYQEESEVS